MNTDTIKRIFQSQFDYTTYCNEIVHNIFGCNDIATSPEQLPTSSDGDQNYFIGRMADADKRDLGFFYTRVAEGSDVRRKRVGLRKLIAPYLKYEVDAAIAVFDDGNHWRLSYICDMKEGVTAAKRFSYILGDPQGQYKTPLERLSDLGTQAASLRLCDIRDAFSVDALSKEFFDEYHRHYDIIVKELERQGNSGALYHDYVKKMLGRIVFLHFLQKKGWLDGNQAFLRDLFFMQPLDRRADFLEKVLEPLFFGIFNTETAQRGRLFSDRYWDKQLLEDWSALPYLNGGLFEEDAVDKLHIKLPGSLFEDLFTFLASYNFTVDENDPDDAEVGVDPEMLGKIFESLLEDNKAKGAFYTPKEIVRYMCKESLIAYLSSRVSKSPCPSGRNLVNLVDSADASNCERSKANNNLQDSQDFASETSRSIRRFVEHHEFPSELEPYRDTLDSALRNVKICDPAIGSGAFPMGLLNELWRCREALSQSNSQSESKEQKEKHNNNIGKNNSDNSFSSDCEKEPSDCMMSRVELKKEIIENNIYGVDIERGAIDIARLRFWLSIVVDAEEPEPLPNFDYKFMQGNSLIESYKGIDLSRISNRLRGGQSKSTQLLLGLDSDFSKKNLQRLMRDYFSVTDHKQKASMRQAINDEVKHLITDFIGGTASDLDKLDPSANQDFFLWHTWFKDIFDNGGFDIVIGNPPYVVVPVGSYPQYDWNSDLYKMFFEISIKDLCCQGGVISMITPKFYLLNKEDYKIRQYFLNKIDLLSLNTCNPFDAVTENVITLLKCSIPHIDSIPYYDFNLNTRSFMRLNDIKKEYCKTNKYYEITYGLDDNTISILQKMYNNGVSLGSLTESKRGAEVSKKYLRESNDGIETLIGQDMHKYSIAWNETYLPTSHKEYRRLKEYYDGESIYLRRVDSMLEATVSLEKKYGFNKNVYGIKKKIDCTYDLLYLLACINSRALDYYYKKRFSTKKTDVFPEIQTYLYEQLPIPHADKDSQDQIIKIVKEILLTKHNDPYADTLVQERSIDRIIFKLFGLSYDEILTIDNSISFSKQEYKSQI